jgi:acyl-coenzyme A synthetase/AMP-(fatty) acid ligase
MRDRPLFNLLNGNRQPHTAVAFGDNELAYDRFCQQVVGLSQTLRGCGSAALTCKDSAAFTIGLFALLSAGVEVVLPPNSQPATIAEVSGTVDRILDDKAVWGVSPSESTASPIGPEASVSFFTSGSTGAPKRIRRSLEMLEREAVTLEKLWGTWLHAVPVLGMVSHQHLFGLTFKILWPLAAGRAFDNRTHEVWESLINALPDRAIVVSSPAHLSRLGGIAPLPANKRPAAIFSAGAPLPLEASQEAEVILGCRPTEIFGSTETGAIATRRQTVAEQDWTMLPGHHLLDHSEGLLRLYSPYDGKTVETADFIEPRGNGFRFLGRAGRIVKIAGKRVGLNEVERALTSLPWIGTAAAVALSHDRLGAVAVLTDQGRACLAELGTFRFGRFLRRELAAGLDPAAIPKLWRFVSSLPQHPMGKSLTADLQALFAEETA